MDTDEREKIDMRNANSDLHASVAVEEKSLTGATVSNSEKKTRKEKIVSALKSKSKRFYLISGLVSLAVVALLYIIGWLSFGGGLRQLSGVPLVQYSNDNYSIQVPDSYKKTESSMGDAGKSVTFASPDDTKRSVESKVNITAAKLTEQCKKECINGIDNDKSTHNPKENWRVENVNVSGMDGRIIKKDMYNDEKLIGKYTRAVFVGDTMIYEIVISSAAADPGLSASTDKIINSFTAKLK